MTSVDPHSPLFLGLMSGTSADGIDAALVRFEGEGRALRCQLVHGRTFAWDEATRIRLVALGQGADTVSLDALGALDATVALAFADAALALLQDAGMPPEAAAKYMHDMGWFRTSKIPGYAVGGSVQPQTSTFLQRAQAMMAQAQQS